MKKIDLNIKVDDLNLGMFTDDDNIRPEVRKNGDMWEIVKVLVQSDSLDGAQKALEEMAVKKSGCEVANDYINLAFGIHQNEQDPRTGKPRGAQMPEQRKIYKVLEALDGMKDGIMELDDDRYEFLKEIFNNVNWVGGTKVVVRIGDRLEEANIEQKK